MALNIIKWIDSIKGPVDADGNFGAQCMDLVRKRRKDAGLPQAKGLGRKGVKYLSIQRNKYLSKGQLFIDNNPKNFPKPGDAVVFRTPTLTGHIAIVLEADVNKMKIFEQNFGNGNGDGKGQNAPRLRTVGYKDVLGRITYNGK